MSIKLGLLGNEIEYSRSKELHRTLWEFQQKHSGDSFFAQSFEYVVLDTAKDFCAYLESFHGLQVTQPWKGIVSSMLPGVSGGNTLVRKSDDLDAGWKVHDTDIAGLYAALADHAKDYANAKSVVVFGFGDLAKKFLLSAHKHFSQLSSVQLLLRDSSDGHKTNTANTWLKENDLAQVQVSPWSSGPTSLQPADLVLQLSSAPHRGDQMEAWSEFFAASCLVFDACYAPTVAYGSGEPANFIGGGQMLIAQALEAWKLWGIPTHGMSQKNVENILGSN
jgi:shikimate 5-dehydrogenase